MFFWQKQFRFQYGKHCFCGRMRLNEENRSSFDRWHARFGRNPDVWQDAIHGRVSQDVLDYDAAHTDS